MNTTRSVPLFPDFRREVADRILFMDGGQIVEEAPPAELFTSPQNPRTKEFLSKIL